MSSDFGLGVGTESMALEVWAALSPPLNVLVLICRVRVTRSMIALRDYLKDLTPQVPYDM